MIFIDLLNPSLSQTHLFGGQNIENFLKISKICMNFVEKWGIFIKNCKNFGQICFTSF